MLPPAVVPCSDSCRDNNNNNNNNNSTPTQEICHTCTCGAHSDQTTVIHLNSMISFFDFNFIEDSYSIDLVFSDCAYTCVMTSETLDPTAGGFQLILKFIKILF